MERDKLRKAFGQFATGVTVITTAHEGDVHGMTANSFTSVSLDPPIVLVCVSKRATMHARLLGSGRFGISILTRAQVDAANRFAGRGGKHPVVFEQLGAARVLPGALAQFDCAVAALHEAADHVIVTGMVEDLRLSPGEPLVFHSSRYQHLVNDAAHGVGIL